MAVKPISLRVLPVRRSSGLAHFQVAVDVLQHHDAVVHQDADHEGERHQRHQVQREPEGRTSMKVGIMAAGQGHEHEERAAQAVQEHEHHETHDQHGQRQDHPSPRSRLESV
jgi:hypothetical protein